MWAAEQLLVTFGLAGQFYNFVVCFIIFFLVSGFMQLVLNFVDGPLQSESFESIVEYFQSADGFLYLSDIHKS